MDTKELDAIAKAAGSPSGKRKEKYRGLWLAYVAEHGYDEAAENYLFDGYQLLSELTLAEYLSSCGKPLESYQQILRGARFQGTSKSADNNKKLGLHLILLSDLLARENPNRSLLGAVAGNVIRFSYKKPELTESAPNLPERMTKLPEMLKRLLVFPLKELHGKKTCPIQSFEMVDVRRKSFCKMIVESIPEEVARPNAPQFLQECKQIAGLGEASVAQETAEKEKKDVPVVFSNPVTTVKAEPKEAAEDNVSMTATEDEAVQLRRELAAQSKRADILTMKLEATGKEREAAARKLEEADAKNAELQKDVAAARAHAESLQAELAKKDGEIGTLQAEIASRKEDYDRLEATLSKQQQASLNRLAQDLGIVYADFQDAQPLEMSVDLGENLRDELADVFHTLEKYGLHFDA